MLCILYVIAVGALMGTIGLLVERVLPQGWPRRWVWCLVIPISIIIPGVYRTRHAWSVTPMLEGPSASRSGLIAFIDSCNPIINRFWLITSGALVILGLVNALRVSLVIYQSRRKSEQGSPTAIDGIPVVVTDSVGPATFGLVRARVLVPRWVLALPKIQRQYVLRHEDEHRKASDQRLLFVMSLTLLLMPWNLSLWWLLRRLRLAVELDCDNRVVGALGNPRAYGELLFKIGQAASRGPRLQPALLGVGMLERRLTVLLAPTPLKHIQRFMLPAAAFALLLVVLWMPHPVLGPESHANMTMTSAR
jgi:beta-lactamase regulating signal transducer with metallopeptidase domain